MPETVGCNLCAAAEGTSQPKVARFLSIPEPFGICRCRRCGLVYLSPRPTVRELGAIYTTHPYYSAKNATRGEPRRPFYASRMSRLERWRPQRGTMLAIGCLEGGYALEVAKNRGWHVFAIESSAIFAAHAREQLGLEVQVAEGWDLSTVTGQQFDVIYSHSFEHLPDPRGTLRQCRNLLAREGLVMLEVPNQLHSLKNRIKRAIIGKARSAATGLEEVPAEVHTYYFDPRTVRTLLRNERFQILEFHTYLPWHPVHLANPRFRWLQELVYAVGGLLDRGPTIEVIARPIW